MLSFFNPPSKSQIDFRALVESGAALVDVRTPDEYAHHHIPGAVNIPLRELPGRISDVGDPSRDVVVHCQSGGRSRNAANYLRKVGFSSVHDLGGIGNW